MGDWTLVPFEAAPINIIDGDRGTNYPHQEDFHPVGHCLFLNAGNVTATGFDFANCAFVSKEKDAMLRKGKLSRDDVVLTTRGTVGNTAYFNRNVPFDNIRINSGMVILRAKPGEVEPLYLYLFVRSEVFKAQVAALLTGSAQPQLPIRDINRIGIPIPPLSDQRAIASILGAFDNKIDVNRRMNETLEAMARAIFKDWFVDFGPTRAKIEGRAPYLSPEIWALFPNRLDDEGKPQGWERIALRQVAEILSGGTPSKARADYWNGSIPWISPKVMTGLHVSESPDCVTPESIGNGTRFAPMGSVLVMVRGMGLHQGVRISQARCDVTFNQDVKALVPKDSSATHLLLAMLDAAPYLFSKVESSGHGTGTLPTIVLDGIHFVLPTGTRCKQLTALLDPLNDRIAANDAENTTLGVLRDLLLPKLMSGELPAGDAAREIEAAL